MKLNFEYGQGTMAAELPDNTDVFIPGETVKDPAYIPEDQLEAAYLESLAHPIGMPTLTELAGPGKTVTIVVPDRVKGGEQATSHRKLSIKYILKELYAAGIEKKDILLLFPMDFIQEVQKQMQKLSLEKNYLMNSGIQGRSSVMTAKIRSIWYIWEPLTEGIRVHE